MPTPIKLTYLNHTIHNLMSWLLIEDIYWIWKKIARKHRILRKSIHQLICDDSCICGLLWTASTNLSQIKFYSQDRGSIPRHRDQMTWYQSSSKVILGSGGEGLTSESISTTCDQMWNPSVIQSRLTHGLESLCLNWCGTSQKAEVSDRAMSGVNTLSQRGDDNI